MPVFFEFLLVAFLIYLWESVLWIPKHGVVLGKRWFFRSWYVTRADRILSFRELGAIPLSPFVSYSRLAPCGEPPLAVDGRGSVFVKSPDGVFHDSGVRSRDGIRFNPPHLSAGNLRTRCQSSHVPAELTKAFSHSKDSVDGAVRRMWKLSMSASRARLTQRKWRLASEPLRLYCPLLTIGFFVGIPASYLTLGPAASLWIGLWLWFLMLSISIRLFWIAKRVYPHARAAIRQDAWLSLVIPFHAMRVMELCSVHAFSTTHPAAHLLANLQISHPWLGAFTRSLVYPRQGVPGDLALAETALPILERELSRFNLATSAYLQAPDQELDREAVSWCPRCHGMFTETVVTCSDCGGIALKKFA